MIISEERKFPELTKRKIVIICVFAAFLLYWAGSFLGSLKENVIASEKRTVAAVKSGINQYYLESFGKGRKTAYPSVLDEAQDGFAAENNPLFTNILAYPGITQGRWRKLLPDVYQGPRKSFYFYDRNSGDFSEKALFEPFIEKALRLTKDKITGQLISRMRSRAVVAFSDGNELIGGAVLLLPRLSGKFILKGSDCGQRVFSFSGGEIDAEVAVKSVSLRSPVKFGYYTFDPAAKRVVLNEVFSGEEAPSVRSTFNLASGKKIGFYFSLPGDMQELYFSEPEYNQDKIEHLRVFENPALKKITVAFDRSRSDTRQFQDMIVTISY